MAPVIKGTISLSEEYSVQKLRSAFLFNPAGDKNEECLESLHQETGLDKQVIKTTFTKLRKRMNLKRFKKISESETLTEDIGDDVKRSGISPIAYHHQDKPSLSPPRKTEKTGRPALGSPNYNNDAERLLRETKSVNNSPSPVSAPAVRIKSEPRLDLPHQSRVKAEPRVKEEALTIEEKARQYDVLKADFAGLQAQMEELKKRLQGTGGTGGEVKPPVVKAETVLAPQSYHHHPHHPHHQPQYPGYPPWQPPPPYQMFYPPGPAPPPPYLLPSYPSYQENISPGYQAQYYPGHPAQPPPVLLQQHIKQEPTNSQSQTKYLPIRPKQ